MTKTSQTKFKETELGEIPEDWENIVLRNLIEEVIDNRGKTPPLSKDGHEMIEVNAIKDDFVAPDYSVIRKFVDDDTYKNWFRGHIEVGDVLVSTVGTIGNISLIKEKRGVVAQNVIALRPKNRLDSSYLYYYLKSPNQKNELRNLNIGGVQPSIKVPHLLNLQITVPPLPEQQKIAEVLGALDQKIELNRKMNKTLESLARAVFKKWFIDDADPNWESKKLGDFFLVKTGKKDANFSSENGQYPFFTCSQGHLMADDYSFDCSAILLAGNGDFNIKWYEGKFEAYQRTYVLEPYDKNLLGFLYFAIKYNLNDITAGHRGSVINFLTKGMIENYEINIPNIAELDEKSKIFKIIISKMDFNTRQIETLSRIRDSLLPRLMSGKLRVR